VKSRGRSWPVVQLGEQVDLLAGFAFKSHRFTDDSADIHLVKGENVQQGYVDWEKAKHWPAADWAVYEKFQLRHGDVVLAMDRPWIEAGLKFGWITERAPRALLVQRVSRLRGTDTLSTKFLRFIIGSPAFTDYIKPITTGVNVPHISPAQIKDFKFALPPLATQHRIASILSAYDDLIENNTRRIAILEEMARRIYEEWFVHFRFPGHEQVRMVDSELGLIPEGWQPRPLGELLEHHIGGGWGEDAGSDEFSVQAYVIRGTDIPDVRCSSLGRSPLRFHKESNFRTRQIKPRDIVFEVSGGSKDQPVGRSVQVRPGLLRNAISPVICASFCRLVRANAKQILPELIQLHFEMIYANREIMKYQTQSTGITNFKFMVFLEKEIVLVPDINVQDQFEQAVLPLFALADSLGLKNTNLRTTRDLLLPKLISGELDVSYLPEPEAIAA
jgi:type I restriction enzyme S subunit